MSWLWIFLPVALVVIAAVIGLPLWQSVWARDRNEDHSALHPEHRLHREAVSADATPQSRPHHVHH